MTSRLSLLALLLVCLRQPRTQSVVAFTLLAHNPGLNATYYLSRAGQLHRIPNAETVRELGADPSSLPAITSAQLRAWEPLGSAVPSLKARHASSSPDERTRIKIYKALVLSAPESYWRHTWTFGKMLNPALTRWQGGLVLVWRRGLYVKGLNWAWLSTSSAGEAGAEAAAAAPAHYSLSPSPRIGLGPSSPHSPYAPSARPPPPLPFHALMEDPRLVPLLNGSLLVVFTGKATLFTPPKQGYFLLHPPQGTAGAAAGAAGGSGSGAEGAGVVAITPPRLMERPSDPAWEEGQKNWVPFQPLHSHGPPGAAAAEGRGAEASVYFIRSLHPMHVVAWGAPGANDTVDMVDVVPLRGRGQELPWHRDFGWPLRGGTPALLVLHARAAANATDAHAYAQARAHPSPLAPRLARPPDPASSLLLLLFHTVAHHHPHHPLMRTYYMGALALCPLPPFRIHAMTRAPILNASLYEVKWVEGATILLWARLCDAPSSLLSPSKPKSPEYYSPRINCSSIRRHEQHRLCTRAPDLLQRSSSLAHPTPFPD